MYSKSSLRAILRQIHPSMQLGADAYTELTRMFIDHIIDPLCSHLGDAEALDEKAVIAAFDAILTGDIKKHCKSETVKYSKSDELPLALPVKSTAKMFAERDVELESRMVRMATAGLEYICAEVFELAGNLTIEQKKRRITADILLEAIKNDDELSALFS